MLETYRYLQREVQRQALDLFWTLCVTHLAEKAQLQDSTEERELPCPSTRSTAGKCCCLEENSPQNLVKSRIMEAARRKRWKKIQEKAKTVRAKSSLKLQAGQQQMG